MSTTADLDEKLAIPATTPGVAAQARLKHLLARWRAEGVDGSSINPKAPPELVLVTTMRRETWKLVRRETPGVESLYELLEVMAP